MSQKAPLTSTNHGNSGNPSAGENNCSNDQFLQQLRSSQNDHPTVDPNADTIGVSNTATGTSPEYSNLAHLFQPPPPPPPLAPSIDASLRPPRGIPLSVATSRDTEKPSPLQTRGVSWSKQGRSSNRSLLAGEDLLEAVRSPFESEVEAALLKAMDYTRRHRSNSSAASTILSQVPNTSCHDFVVENTPSMAEGEDNAGNDLNDTEQQRRPLLNREASVSRKHLLVDTHHIRKNSTIEDTLHDLTTAMSALHSSKQPSFSSTNGSSGADLGTHMLHMTEQQAPVSNSAAVESSPTEEGSQDGGRSLESKNSRRGTGGNNLPTLVEEKRHTTSGETSEDDIEMGNMPNRGTSSAVTKRNTRKSLRDPERFKEDWERWTEVFRPHKQKFFAYAKTVLLYFVVPLLGVAVILYYFAGNPRTGVYEPGDEQTKPASASYILLFCVRQIVTFSMALGLQAIFIDLLALNTRILMRLVGPIVTLLIVQSKGWPHILFWWSILGFAILSGPGVFAKHWMFYQGTVGVFSESNPSGEMVNNEWYLRALAVAVSVSIVVAVKRFVLGLYFARQQFSHYGETLANIMHKVLMISEVAGLGRRIDDLSSEMPADLLRCTDLMQEGNETIASNECKSQENVDNVVDLSKRDPLTGSLHFSEKLKLMQLLDQWEEPTKPAQASNEIGTISAVLRFRKALLFMQHKYPFSRDFGDAHTREACIESSQALYERLTKHMDDPTLRFETLALLALDTESEIDQRKAKDMIKLFRPDREGNLTMIDFIKSIDAVYKEFRMLQATIDNASRIDQAFENMFNWVFYTVVATVVLSALDFNPLALFLSLSSVILAFAFAIGNARYVPKGVHVCQLFYSRLIPIVSGSSKYFEGVLCTLVLL